MNCQNCGAKLEKVVTDLPFKLKQRTIVILKNLPVLQCKNCNEYLIADAVMEQVDHILKKVDKSAELEVCHYAA